MTGLNLTDATAVTVSGAPVAFTVVNDSTIEFTAPAGLAGTSPTVIVTDGAARSDTLANAFAYQRVDVALSSSLNPAASGQSVTFTATLSGANAPSGVVSFTAGGTAIGTASIVGNVASLAVSTLPVGNSQIVATYAGDLNNVGAASLPLAQTVTAATPGVALASSLPLAPVDTDVTFTATISGGNARTGTVEFFADAASIGASPLSGSTASLTTRGLPVGTSTITAVYSGDANNASANSNAVTQVVVSTGTIRIRQLTTGGDGRFAFTSATAELNFTIVTTGGSGDSALVDLVAGTYQLTVSDASANGFSLSAITCSDADSTGDIAGRTLTIRLAVQEALTCTFTAINSRDRTSEMIGDFMAYRAAVLLANEGDTAAHIDRLNGVGGSATDVDGITALMGLMPIANTAGTINLSLGAIDRAVGNNNKPTDFDLWLKGTFGALSSSGADGDFGLVSAGFDYTVNRDLLLGGFVQVDQVSQDDGVGSVSGTGWIAGPYATARLAENLFLDLKAAFGTSSNQISPFGTYRDDFGATRWLLSAALAGQWTSGQWTFSPAARLSYFEETSASYTDSLGVFIPSITAGLGQFALGPKISYRFDLEGDVVIDTGLRFEGVLDIVSSEGILKTTNAHGRVEGSLGLNFGSGLTLGASLTYDGIGGQSVRSFSGKLTLQSAMP